MAKWAHADVIDDINTVATNCNAVLLLKGYTPADTYATVNGAGVKVASAVMVGGDFTKGDGAASSRTLTADIDTKSGGNALINTVNGTDDLHLAFVDTTNSKVLFVTDETTNQSITTGNPVTFSGAPVYTRNQPA